MAIVADVNEHHMSWSLMTGQAVQYYSWSGIMGQAVLQFHASYLMCGAFERKLGRVGIGNTDENMITAYRRAAAQPDCGARSGTLH